MGIVTQQAERAHFARSWWTGSPAASPRTKVGHAGTLDPLATGILIVCVGRRPG